MIEMPGLPGHQLLALDLDDRGFRAGADRDHADHVVIALRDALDRLHRVILERANDFAQQNLHAARLLDTLEHDHTAIEEHLVDLAADTRILQRLTGDAGDPGTEGQIVLQRPHIDQSHLTLLMTEHCRASNRIAWQHAIELSDMILPLAGVTQAKGLAPLI